MPQKKLEMVHHFLSPSLEDENAPKIVFLHGVMGFAANWRRIAKAFETQAQTLCFDQRGHGRSFQPPSGYAPKDYALDLLEIIDELGWPKIHLVGHSMGGRNALEFASLYPQRLHSLVIEDIGPKMNPEAAGFLLKLVDSVPVPFSSKKTARLWFDTEFEHLWPGQKNLAEFLYANLSEDSEKRCSWRFYLPGIRASIVQGRAQERWREIEALQMPTLLIRGANSEDLQKPMFDEILRRNSSIQGVEIPGAGHWVHSDKPDEFIAALTQFWHWPVPMAHSPSH